MKRLILMAGLVMATAVCACSGTSGKKAENALAGIFDDGGKVKMKMGDREVEVDSFIFKNYGEKKIYKAMQRDEYVKKVSKPKSAAGFGKKLSQTVWKAYAPRNIFIGEVVVTYYEKGVEVNKDGKSWFYDFAHMSYQGDKAAITATESVLHPGVWEPAVVTINTVGSQGFKFQYIYDCGCPETEIFYMFDYKQKEFNTYKIEDLIVSQKKY